MRTMVAARAAGDGAWPAACSHTFCHSIQAAKAPADAAASFSVQARFHSAAASAGVTVQAARIGQRAAIVSPACIEVWLASRAAFASVRERSRWDMALLELALVG